MSGAFSFDKVDYVVSNVRFSNLFKWALECSKSIDDENRISYISKMSQLSEDVFIPHTFVQFESHFDTSELDYWSKVFYQLGYDIYEGKIGNQENRDWQPGAIADSIQISKLLKELSYKNK